MTTETTIKTLVGSEWQGKMKYTVTLADGTVGYLQDKSDDGLKEGDAVTATIEEYTSKAGKKSNLITLTRRAATQDTPQQSKNVGEQLSEKFADPAYFKQPKSYDEMKCDLRVTILQSLGVIVAAGKIEPKVITTYFNDIYPALDLSIDDLSK